MKNLYKQRLNKKTVDEAFSFYDLDEKYKPQAYKCLQEILGNGIVKNRFLDIFELLFLKNSDEFKCLWRIKDTELMFGEGVNPFITNLMILLGGGLP